MTSPNPNPNHNDNSGGGSGCGCGGGGALVPWCELTTAIKLPIRRAKPQDSRPFARTLWV